MKIYEHVEAVPSRIVGLFNLLLKAGRGGLEEGMAKALLQPKTLREADAPPSALAPRTIDAAIETGLVARSNVGDTTILALAVDAYETLSKSKDRPDSIRRLLEKRLLTPMINGQKNYFAFWCAWLLTRSATWLPQRHSDIQEAMTADGLDLSQFRATNTSNIDNVLYWARYLGLIWRAREETAASIIPDPTTFLTRHLHELLPPNCRVDAFSFRKQLGSICSVLDGGGVREELLEQIQKATGRAFDDDRISDALSLALRQLAEAKLIDYDCPNDQRRFLRLYDDHRIAFLERSTESSSKCASAETLG